MRRSAVAVVVLCSAAKLCACLKSGGGTAHQSGSGSVLARVARPSRDEHGHLCSGCGEPPVDRLGDKAYNYKKRADCGNQSVFENPQLNYVPLVSFHRKANATHPGTNAFCELNVGKWCADSMYNRDFMFQAKAVVIEKTFKWDGHFCRLNGFLEPEIVSMIHNYDATKAHADNLCKTKYLKYDWPTMTMDRYHQEWFGSMIKGKPTEYEAEFVAAWLCSMGTLGCDIAYCAYTYCDRGKGFVGTYDDCKGWDKVSGMPLYNTTPA